MTKTVHGTVHGNTIQLDQNLGVADGQQVEVELKFIEPGKIGAKESCAQPVRWPTILTGMRSLSKSSSPARSSDGLRERLNDAPRGYQHLLGTHAPFCWSGPSLLPIRWRNCHVDGGFGRTIRRSL